MQSLTFEAYFRIDTNINIKLTIVLIIHKRKVQVNSQIVKMMVKDIYNFLKNFSNIVSDEHKNKLINIQSHLEHTHNLKSAKNKFGEHYEDCVWSDDNTTCGPDTCSCSRKRRKQIEAEEEAQHLMHFYYNIYNVTKCKNCNFNSI